MLLKLPRDKVIFFRLQGSKIGKAKLVYQTQRHPCMLEHVLEREVLDNVVGAVNVVVRVLKCRLYDKG